MNIELELCGYDSNDDKLPVAVVYLSSGDKKDHDPTPPSASATHKGIHVNISFIRFFCNSDVRSKHVFKINCQQFLI